MVPLGAVTDDMIPWLAGIEGKAGTWVAMGV